MHAETQHKNAKVLKAFHHGQVDVLMQRRVLAECRKIEQSFEKEKCASVLSQKREGILHYNCFIIICTVIMFIIISPLL